MSEKVYPGAHRNVCPTGGETASLFHKVYTVSEAVRLIGVESHVLRYWEEELEISIERTSQGHRIYSQQDVELFCRVKELREEGLQLKAIRRVLDQTEGKIPEQPEFRKFCNDSAGLNPGDGTDQAAVRGIGNTRKMNDAQETGDARKTDDAQETDDIQETDNTQETGDGRDKEDDCMEAAELDYEIISTEEPAGGLEQFVAVLKQMIEEVVREQNEKLEQDMKECIQEKMEELYLQYFQVMQEAAVSREDRKKRESILQRLLNRLLRR